MNNIKTVQLKLTPMPDKGVRGFGKQLLKIFTI